MAALQPMKDSNGSLVAVLIDYENVLKLFRENVVPRGQVDWERVAATARRYGSVMICKAYADWEGNLDARERIMRLGIEPVTVPSNNIGKNGVDVKIAVDAIDMTVLKNAGIRTVVLVSGDGDFTPLVNYLKEHGKYVVGMGIRGSTADFLATACHVFLYLEKDERAPDPIETHPLIRQGPPAAATEPARAPEAATARFEVERRQDGATSEALVERYLTALRGRGVEISPNEHRPLILREAHALFKNSGWRTFLQGRDELKELFKRKHPEVMVMHVLDAVYQIQQASCLEWELSFGQFPADTPLHQRKCRLHGSVQTADDLLRKVDAHLLSVVAAAVRPEAVDVPAAARILYGRKPNAELAAYIAGLLGHRFAASSAWPA